MKEFIYLDTEYITSALAQINNGKVVTYSSGSEDTAHSAERNTTETETKQKASMAIPQILKASFGTAESAMEESAVIGIQSAKEMMTKIFDDNAYDLLYKEIKENKLIKEEYSEGDFVLLNGEYMLIDINFLIMMLGKDFVAAYTATDQNILNREQARQKGIKATLEQQKKGYEKMRKELELFSKMMPSSDLLSMGDIVLPMKKNFFRSDFQEISFKYKKINLLAKITRKFTAVDTLLNGAPLLLNGVDYMMPSIMQIFSVDISDKYIGTPVAIYID